MKKTWCINLLRCSFVSGFLFAVPTSLLAIPASPEPAIMEQPNGQEVEIYLRGDEFLHWNEDAQGFTVLKSEATEAWVYAEKDVSGELIPSAAVVGQVDPIELGVEKHLVPESAIERAALSRTSRMSSSEQTDGPQKLPTTGTQKNLVLLVDFSDVAGTYTLPQFEALFNTVGYSTGGAAGSVKDYFHEVSYNQLTVDSTVVDWITLDNTMAFYDGNPREMVREGLQKLEARGFDFSTMDADGDGDVDGLTVIHAGGGEEFSGNPSYYIWSHKWQMVSPVTYDGKTLYRYHTEPERYGWDSNPSSLGFARIGVICHENGHFLGLPDLYDTDYSSEGVGKFCLMAGGSWNGSQHRPAHMSAWCKTDLGWVTPTIVSGNGIYTALRVEDNQSIYKLQGAFPSTQYFLIENRQGYGFDASMPGSTRGLLIWHIDETKTTNSDETHYKVDLEEASGPQHLETDTNSGEDSDYYRSGNVTIFSDITTPNNKSYANTDLGLNITDVSVSGSSMTFAIGSVVIPGEPIPYAESFESGMGVWGSASGSDFNWSERTGTTPSSSTGPSGASDGSYYIYTEASGNTPSRVAGMEARFDFSNAPNPVLQFDYHMYGAAMGSLHVDVYDGSTWYSNVWSISGQQQASSSDAWEQAKISLASVGDESSAIVRFRGITGSSYRSDMAIDNLSLYNYGYQVWASDEGIPVGQRGYEDSPAGDGIGNIWKYASGLNAMASYTKDDLYSSVINTGAQQFVVTYYKSKNAPDADVMIDWDSGLSIASWHTNNLANVMMGETSTQETWQATIPMTNDAGFIRMTAELQE